MNKLLYLCGAALLAYLIAVFGLGMTALGTISVTVAVFVLGMLWLMKGLGIKYANGMPLQKRGSLYVGLILVGWVVVSMYAIIPGVPSPQAALGGIPAGQLTTTTTAPSITIAEGCPVSTELKGKDAALVIAAWDMEASNPYTSTVNVGTSCWIYKNGNAADNFVGATTATSSTSHSTGFAVGDVASIYCGGTTYYTEKLENHCVDSEDDTINLNAHTIDAETDIAITVYDETGATALTAAGNTTTADYDITLGANEEKDIFVQVKVNSANAALNLKGFATAATNDIDYVMPDSDEGLTKQPIVNFLEDVSISDNDAAGATNQTSDYTPYTWDNPVMFSEWDYKKYHFQIASNSGNPSATDNVFSTIDLGVICILDGTYAKGADGKPYLDFHDHAEANAESNVGMTETFEDPVGKNSCVVLEGN